MTQKDAEMAERDRIRKFDEKVLSYQSNGFPPGLSRKFWGALTVLFTSIGAFMSWDKDFFSTTLMTAVWAMLGPYFYISGYLRIRENGSNVHLYGKIRYLPVDIRQVKIVRIGYLVGLLKKTLVVSLVIQIVFVPVAGTEFLLWRLLFVAVAGGLLPFLVNAATVWAEPR